VQFLLLTYVLTNPQAIYYFMVEFHRQTINDTYKGNYDDVLYLFAFFYHKIHKMHGNMNTDDRSSFPWNRMCSEIVIINAILLLVFHLPPNSISVFNSRSFTQFLSIIRRKDEISRVNSLFFRRTRERIVNWFGFSNSETIQWNQRNSP
jgi:hypothetical protein